jgi:SAM-dependent methyltransferase
MSKQPACDIRGNRIITHVEVATLQPAIDEIQALEPDMLEGKSSLAVAQNAYIFQQVKMAVHRDDDILLVGGHGDPTGPALQKQGYSVRIIDPRIDGNEARNIWLEMLLKTGRLYDMIVCSSVMEHVPDDVSFIYHLYALLKPGGIAFLTAPFLEPEEDFEQDPDSDPDAVPRQYSLNRLENICKHLPERTLFDLPTWEWCDLDVARQEGGFCSLAFRKSVKSPGYEVIGEHRLAGLVYSLGQEMEILRGIIRSLQTPPPPTRTQKIKRFLKTPFVKSR